MFKLRFVNKEHGDVWLVEPSVLIGADAVCQVMLKQDGIKPRHADIQIKGNQLTLVNLADDANLTINGKPCNKQATLNVGDKLAIAGMQVLIVDPKDERKAPSEAQASSGWAIRPNHSALANKIYSINGETVVGRATECDLSFSVSHLSRKHAQLSIVNGQLMVKDLESANGTFVNGKQVQESKLQKGDELRLDTLSFTVIGPGGDSDKTTVRMAVNAPVSATAAKAATPAQAPRPVPAPAAPTTAEREKKRAAGTTTFLKAVNASEEAKQKAAVSSISPVIVILALVVVVIAVVAYVIM
jgi:pSer/pThr/pTyr-binding forkhead associated (FHA) protein